jgi:putative thioredoxin
MEINDADFEEKVIEKSKKMPVIVDFYADWCAPCKMLGPIIEGVVDSYKDKIVLAKVNVDNNPKKSNEFGISSIPAVKIFKDGKVAEEFIGFIPAEMIKQKIDSVLK